MHAKGSVPTDCLDGGSRRGYLFDQWDRYHKRHDKAPAGSGGKGMMHSTAALRSCRRFLIPTDPEVTFDVINITDSKLISMLIGI